MVSPWPNDSAAKGFPVSVKGVVLLGDKVALLLNPRGEWELPGGKLELGETPEQCVVREIGEELHLSLCIGPILDSWVYHIAAGVDVLIITYGFYPGSETRVTHSSEHRAAGLFDMDEVSGLNMPAGYKHSINNWWGQLSSRPLVSEPEADPSG